ncbi:MAG: YetF domain-containing protein [Bacteroidota bacterium]
MLRIAGIRTFGKKSAFDNVIIIMLGAVLSRAIVGSSPFIPTVAAGLTMVIIHRILGLLSYKYDFLGKLVKGDKVLLYRFDKPHQKNMRKTQLSHKDIMEEIRLQLHEEDLDSVKEIWMERNGEVSITRKNN